MNTQRPLPSDHQPGASEQTKVVVAPSQISRTEKYTLDEALFKAGVAKLLAACRADRLAREANPKPRRPKPQWWTEESLDSDYNMVGSRRRYEHGE
jgi:hypothetical protein